MSNTFALDYLPYKNKVIYGDDNRKLMSEVSDKEFELGKAVLAQIARYRVIESSDEKVRIEAKTLEKALNYCPEEKFSDKPLVSSCSGFLVGPDLLLTAGHCLKDKSGCQNNFWVLDYDDKELNFDGESITFSSEKIVHCQEILALNAPSSSAPATSLDYALIRLDKKITDRKPLKLRRVGKADPTIGLTVIGHPLGLPKIQTDKGLLRNNLLNNIFTINSDTFSGNSGSPVIENSFGFVEGILIRGDRDFSLDIDTNCNRSFHCENAGCSGETVLRSTVLPLNLIPR